MAFPQDLTQWRVYSAEQSVPAGEQFETIDEAQTFVWWVQSTPWWSATFPDAPRIRIELGGNSNRHGDIQSYAHETAANEWTVSLHPRMMNALVVLHEVAHCVAPRHHGNVKKISRGVLDLRDHHAHGEYFRAALATLAERFKIGVDPGDLRRAYTHFELETADLDALIKARQHSAEVEQAWAETWNRYQQKWAEDPKLNALREKRAEAAREAGDDAGNGPDGGWIPQERWGDWIWLMRRHFRPKHTQKQLAEQVSPLVKCTARDVARLEHSEYAPDDVNDRLRCLALVAAMGIDPVWAETYKGLTPGESTLSLDSLESIAPDWVATVRRLNALLEARPPRWEAPGDR